MKYKNVEVVFMDSELFGVLFTMQKLTFSVMECNKYKSQMMNFC